MTLIVGIKCKEGIVMAADGAATLGSMGQTTALQPVKKLSVLQSKMVIGVSGAVGLGQRLTGSLNKIWEGGQLSGKKSYEAMAIISNGFREHILPELQVAQAARGAIGNSSLSDALTASLVALPISGSLCLFQFDPQGSPEESTDTLPFVSVGSGQQYADPFLGFLRRVFWSSSPPAIADGIFAAMWTLLHVIYVNPGGVAEPIQLVTLQQNGRDTEIKEYTEEELHEHREAVANAELHLNQYSEKLRPSMDAPEIPEPVLAAVAEAMSDVTSVS